MSKSTRATQTIPASQVSDDQAAADVPEPADAEATDSRYKDFVARHGTDAYELEALDEDDLQQQLRDTINAVMDVDAFNQEVEAEREDAVFLEAQRRIVHKTLREAMADEEVSCDD